MTLQLKYVGPRRLKIIAPNFVKITIQYDATVFINI